MRRETVKYDNTFCCLRNPWTVFSKFKCYLNFGLWELMRNHNFLFRICLRGYFFLFFLEATSSLNRPYLRECVAMCIKHSECRAIHIITRYPGGAYCYLTKENKCDDSLHRIRTQEGKNWSIQVILHNILDWIS